ncbi:MAG: hypothetical protein ACXW37_06745 [Nitrospira sp.]
MERLFKPFQDRVIKELRLAEVSTLETANRFLEGYLPIDNRRFGVRPAQAADLLRPRLAPRELDQSVCLKTTRCLRRDWTVAHHGQLYQVQTNVRATHVMVEERVDGTMRITHHGRPRDYHAIPARPERVAEPPKDQVPRRPVTPRPDHPWRRRLRPERRTQATVANT